MTRIASVLSTLRIIAAASALLGLPGCIFEEDTPDDLEPARCSRVSQCRDGDFCCPAGCILDNDDDCRTSAICGDGIVSGGETCEPFISCPFSCVDGDPCTLDLSTGSADFCNLVCHNTQITWCENGDGCCVRGCGTAGDSDCPQR